MFDLIKMQEPGEPFPSNVVGSYSSPDDCMVEHEFSFDEMSDLLNGKIIQEQYYIQMQPKFLRELAIDEMISERGAMDYDEIAEALGTTRNAIYVAMSKALKHLEEKNQKEKLCSLLTQFFELRSRREFDMGIELRSRREFDMGIELRSRREFDMRIETKITIETDVF